MKQQGYEGYDAESYAAITHADCHGASSKSKYSDIRDEKVRVLKAITPMSFEEVKTNVVRGQYGRGMIDGKPVRAYREEDRVSPDSMTETYMAMKLEIENFRWAGVPFYLWTGKRMPIKTTTG